MKFSAFQGYASAMGIPVVVSPEAQNSDYESGLALIGGQYWHIRTGRNTPNKPGAFVAFWRRDAQGTTEPFSDAEIDAGLLLFVHHQDQRGVFRFTVEHLAQLGSSRSNGPGKRGFRVYPPWCTALNAQATVTQRAQNPAFSTY